MFFTIPFFINREGIISVFLQILSTETKAPDESHAVSQRETTHEPLDYFVPYDFFLNNVGL